MDGDSEMKTSRRGFCPFTALMYHVFTSSVGSGTRRFLSSLDNGRGSPAVMTLILNELT